MERGFAAVSRHAALKSAATGCLLGAAIGDALGLAGEGLSKRRLARMYSDCSRYHFLFRRGMCSDDTEHAAMTAQAWLAARGTGDEAAISVFARSLGWRLRFWLLGLPAGIGLATGRGILRLWLGWPPHRSGVVSAGNGPAMRAAILGVLEGGNRDRLREWIRAATSITHRDPRAEAGALAVALAAAISAAGGRIDPLQACLEIAAELPGDGGLRELVEQAGQSVASGEPTAAFAAKIGCADGVSGFVLHTVPVALHAWLSHPDDIEAALVTAIACGGDTDTVAAIVGGIAGARVGPGGIPQRLLDGLIEWPRNVTWLERLGERLATAAGEEGRAATLPLNIPALLLRNVVFFAVVLIHGVRRLLPPY